jgi:predicted nucleic acid-binding protein
VTVVDASAWVSAFIEEDVFHAASRRWLEDQSGAGMSLAAPALLLPEVGGAVARRTADLQLGLRAINEILRTPGLRFVSLDRSAALRAGQLAVQLRLRGADAVYVEVARLRHEPLLTWDREVRERARGLIDFIAL